MYGHGGNSPILNSYTIPGCASGIGYSNGMACLPPLNRAPWNYTSSAEQRFIVGNTFLDYTDLAGPPIPKAGPTPNAGSSPASALPINIKLEVVPHKGSPPPNHIYTAPNSIQHTSQILGNHPHSARFNELGVANQDYATEAWTNTPLCNNIGCIEGAGAALNGTVWTPIFDESPDGWSNTSQFGHGTSMTIGTANFAVIGGDSKYSLNEELINIGAVRDYSWPPAHYRLTVTDADGCGDQVMFTIGYPGFESGESAAEIGQYLQCKYNNVAHNMMFPCPGTGRSR